MDIFFSVSAQESDEAVHGKGPSLKEEPRNGANEVAVEDDDGVHCAVCGSTDSDPSNPIVSCDGCDLMVHASCCGNPLADAIPDGDWFCSLCVAKKRKLAVCRRSCCSARPAAARSSTSRVRAGGVLPGPDSRDGIGCSHIPTHRLAKDCYNGCALECSHPKCALGIHVSCGLGAGLCIQYQEGKGGAIIAGFCREDTELWEKIVARGQE